MLRIEPRVAVEGAASYVTRQRGPAFIGHTVNSYALILAGVGVQARWLVSRSARIGRRQAAILIASALTTMLVNLIYLFGPSVQSARSSPSTRRATTEPDSGWPSATRWCRSTAGDCVSATPRQAAGRFA